MKNRYYLWVVVFVLILNGCGAPKVLTSYKNNAENAALSGDFKAAVVAWEQYFNQNPVEDIAGGVFAQAAHNAFKAGNLDLAVKWFDQARYKSFSDVEMYSTLADIYKSKENLSKELSSLEYITENFDQYSEVANNRLFEIYFEIEAMEKALMVWEFLDTTSKADESKLNSYFLIQKKLEKDSICDLVSLDLLKINAENLDALEWNAKKYYWLGENRYKSEMDKYNKNKTTRQYRILLKQLDLATADYKKSLVYFEKLWKLDSGEKYTSYFANIYARFGDEKKSNYYKNLIK